LAPAVWFLVATPVGAQKEGTGTGPVIVHDPVRVAVKGEPLSLLTEVKPSSGSIKSVTLHYTLSRHGAPVDIEMKSTGMNLYSATIPGDFIQRTTHLYYYIEAVGEGDQWTESTWYAVEVKDPNAPGAPAKKIASSKEPEGESRNWGTVALIGAGAVGIAAAAVALSDSGGGGGGGGSGTSSNDVEGVYVGVVTICFTPQGEATTCSQNDTTVAIDEAGGVNSGDLAGGTPASGTMNGNQFSIRVPASQIDPALLGSVLFNAVVRDGVISGNITGSTESEAQPGNYSGTFTAGRL